MRTGGGKAPKGSVEATGDKENSERIAEKVQYLFETYRKADGTYFTPMDIERASGGRLKYTWIWKLTRAVIWRPALDDLIELTKVFGCEPELWVTPLENWKNRQHIAQQQALQTTSEPVHTIAMRSLNLTPPGQKIVLDMIESLERSGFTTKTKDTDRS